MIILTSLSIIVFAIIVILIYFADKNRIERKNKYHYWKTRERIAREAIQKLQSMQENKDLMELFDLHKSLAEPLELDKSKSLGPCPWGYFRTESIKTMLPEEVYLGDVYGLWTFNLLKWKNTDSTMKGNGFGMREDILCRDLIFSQYYRILKTGLLHIELKAITNASTYE